MVALIYRRETLFLESIAPAYPYRLSLKWSEWIFHNSNVIAYHYVMKDLLRTADLSRSDIELLLDTAADFTVKPLLASSALANRTVAIYMTKPSTRTRLASETAVAHLGGTPIFIRGDELQIDRGETIADTARIISGYASALIIRTFRQSDVDELGANSTIPVINGLTDDDHPTQLLALAEISRAENLHTWAMETTWLMLG